MMPRLKPGDKILVSTLPYFFSHPKVGDVVVFKYENKLMVKKISKIENEKYLIEGENKKDSLKTPRIKKKDILGKLILKI